MVEANLTSPDIDDGRLAQWLAHALDWPVDRLQVRIHGAHLHVLCEGTPCPQAADLEARTLLALAHDGGWLALTGERTITHVLLYGRPGGAATPDWTRSLTVPTVSSLPPGAMAEPLGRSGPATPAIARSRTGARTKPRAELKTGTGTGIGTGLGTGPEESACTAVPPVGAGPSAKGKGTAAAIADRPTPRPHQRPTSGVWDKLARRTAQTLGEFLHGVGIPARVTVKIAPLERHRSAHPSGDAVIVGHRLWAICQTPTPVDWAPHGEALARLLRSLDLSGFRDGLIIGQSDGRSEPDWLGRVNLADRDRLLRHWARWGDVQALTRLFDGELATLSLPVAAVQKEATLHVFCRRRGDDQPLDQGAITARLAPLIRSIAPQGIHSLILYGYDEADALPAQAQLLDRRAMPPQGPLWVDWIDLPAIVRSGLAESALDLARQGDRAALTFLLERRVNPDLNTWLATGGIRVQLCRRGDLLHIMEDAPHCPDRDATASAIAALVQQLQIPGLSGVRVYGRPAGQKQPQWQYGQNFVTRHAPDPAPSDLGEAGETPDFGTTDPGSLATVRQAKGPIVHSLVSPQPGDPWWSQWPERWGQGARSLLIQTGLFAPRLEAIDLTEATEAGDEALTDLELAAPPTVQGIAAAGLLGLMLAAGIDWTLGGGSWAAVGLAARPLEGAIAERTATKPERPEFPSFNSPQFDQQLALYQQYVLTQGVPDVLVVGSSRALRGIDPSHLARRLKERGHGDLRIFNLGINGATARVVEVLLVQVLPPEQLPKLILWADGVRAFNEGRTDATYQAMAASPAYRLMRQGRFPQPILPGDRAIVATAEPTPGPEPTTDAPAAIAADATNSPGSPGSPDSPPPLTSSREVPEAIQGTRLGVWLSQLPTPSDLDVQLQLPLGQISSAYQQRDRLKGDLHAQLQAIGRAGRPSPKVKAEEALKPILPAIAAGARRRLGGAPAVTAGRADGILKEDGFLPLSVKFNPQDYYRTHARVSGEFDSDYRGFGLGGSQGRSLERVLTLAQQRGSQVVFVNAPLTGYYLDEARRDRDREFVTFMEQQRPLLFIDMARLWVDRVDRFSDPSHLNRYGADAFVEAIAASSAIPWPKATQNPSPVPSPDEP
jgi:hypothetical protein